MLLVSATVGGTYLGALTGAAINGAAGRERYRPLILQVILPARRHCMQRRAAHPASAG